MNLVVVYFVVIIILHNLNEAYLREPVFRGAVAECEDKEQDQKRRGEVKVEGNEYLEE